MKTITFAVAVSVLGIGSAIAADMPVAVKARPAPPPIVVTNWTGCYIGGGGGYGMYNQRREVIAPYGNFATAGANATSSLALAIAAPVGGVLTPNETFGGEGWLATGQIGCDYQMSSNWLIGAFVDADWSDIKGDHGLLSVFSGQQTMRWSWAVGGRLGYLVTPSLLTYVTGGWTEANFSGVNYNHFNAASAIALTGPGGNTALAMAVTGPGPQLQLGGQTYDGFFLGGGTEYAISMLPGLFWKNEYRYADYRNATTNILCPICTAAAPGPVGQSGLAERTHTTTQTVRTELVWRFNWASPVVARY